MTHSVTSWLGKSDSNSTDWLRWLTVLTDYGEENSLVGQGCVRAQGQLREPSIPAALPGCMELCFLGFCGQCFFCFVFLQLPLISTRTYRLRKQAPESERTSVSLAAYYVILKWKVKVTQSCPILCDPMDYGILQDRILEWVAVPFSRGSSQPRDQTQISCIAGRFFTSWATREAQGYWSG